MVEFIEETDEDRAGRLGYKAIGYDQAYYEDGLAGYKSGRSPDALIKEIFGMLTDAGAKYIDLRHGSAEGRPAYQLRFQWLGVGVEVLQVALPIRDRKTPNKISAAKRQALYHLLNEIHFELGRRHFHPDLPAFVPYMIGKGGVTIGSMVADNEPMRLENPELKKTTSNFTAIKGE